MHILDPQEASGVLDGIGTVVGDEEESLGNDCLRDVADVDGDGLHDFALCGAQKGLIFRGGNADTTVEEAYFRLDHSVHTPLGYSTNIKDFVRYDERLLLGTGALVSLTTPIEPAVELPPVNHPEVVHEAGSEEFRGTATNLVTLAGRSGVLAMRGLHHGRLSAVAVLPEWPADGSWDSAVGWLSTPDAEVLTLRGGDVDGDGQDDLIVNSNNGRVFVITDPMVGGDITEAPITFESPTRESFSSDQPYPGFLQAGGVGDLNHDGFADLVMSVADPQGGPVPPRIAVFLGPRGAGTYTLTDADLVFSDPGDVEGAFPFSMEIADLNDDGDHELVVGYPLANGDGFRRGMVATYDDLFPR